MERLRAAGVQCGFKKIRLRPGRSLMENTSAQIRSGSEISGALPRFWSATKEQPQQNNNRNRHTQQPKQKSAAHCFLHACQCRNQERQVRRPVPSTGRRIGMRMVATANRRPGCESLLQPGCKRGTTGPPPHQWPVFGIDVHGSCGGSASPFCSSSIECKSGERTNAIWPSRGGRLMVIPSFIRWSQVA
jgi:hypothetical protein